jgi:ankyrin repeat protein
MKAGNSVLFSGAGSGSSHAMYSSRNGKKLKRALEAGDFAKARKLMEKPGFNPQWVGTNWGIFKQKSIDVVEKAIQTGNIQLLLWMAEQFGKEEILIRKDDPLSKTSSGESRLFYHLDEPETTRMLLQSGARPDVINDSGYPLLYRAIDAGELETAQILLDYAADNNAQVTAGKKTGKPKPDVLGMTALDLAIENHNYTAIRMLVAPDELNSQPDNEVLRKARRTLARYTDPYRENSLHVNAMMRVARLRDTEALDLVKNNIDDINRGNSQGITPLMEAALGDNFDPQFFEKLQALGANINAGDNNGDTLLMKLAAQNPRYHTDFAYFVKRGANVNAANSQGHTALHFALAKPASARIVKQLVTLGADINVKDKSGSTPLSLALAGNRFDIAGFLFKKGAELTPEAVMGNPILNRMMLEQNLTIRDLDRNTMDSLLQSASAKKRKNDGYASHLKISASAQ